MKIKIVITTVITILLVVVSLLFTEFQKLENRISMLETDPELQVIPLQ